MTSRFFRLVLTILAVLFSGMAFAEVSDKFASIQEILLQGIFASIVCFLLAKWRVWLVVIGVAAGFLMLSGVSMLWYDADMADALIAEQGIKYFVVIGLSGLAVVFSAVIGGYRNKQRQRSE